MSDPGMQSLSEAFTLQGLDVVRFNFLYRQKGSNRPDPMPRLRECIVAVVERAREELQPPLLFIGGRSMGGRAASMLAADGFPCNGLLLLAYPLHPPGRPEKLRVAHLARISVPVLCLNGTRDRFCSRELMDGLLDPVRGNWKMHWLQDADHSFHVPKSSSRTDAAVVAEIGTAVGEWVRALGRTRTGSTEAPR